MAQKLISEETKKRLWSENSTYRYFQSVKRSKRKWGVYISKEFVAKDQFLGHSKIKLHKCHVVLWIHVIDPICISR